VNNGTFKQANGDKFKFDRYGDPTTASSVGGYLVKAGKTLFDAIA
jgi:branched-chain amino acid transport system substrate-binding protein